jgi:hypothetical protein
MASQWTRRRGGAFMASSRRYSKTRKQNESYAPGPCQCRPRVGNHRPASGCIPQAELLRFSMPVLGTQGGGVQTPKKLRELISKKLNISPSDEASFVKALPISEEEKARLIKEYLRPQQPDAWKSDPDMWLDSNNIRDVMTQYEEDRKDFKFLGPFPIDFAAPDPYEKKETCLVNEICKIDIEGLKRAGKTKVGIIYNLDPHYKSGSHWVGNYIDLNKHCCYYFDSYGMKTPKQIEKFMQFLTLQDPNMKLAYNARRFQFQGSECGMYSMYFIIRMMMGEPFLRFCRRAPRDGVMLALRNWLFSK